jgi:hypothetical protein
LSPNVITFLSQITSSAVEKVSFRIGYDDPRDVNTFPLEQVEEILTGPLFSGLQAVVFNLYGGAARSGADDIPPIRMRMKRLDRRGVLQFIVMNQSVHISFISRTLFAKIGIFVLRNPAKRYLRNHSASQS